MDHEKNCGCQDECNCSNNMEEVKAEVQEVIHEVQDKVEEIKDQVVDYAKEHEIKDKAENIAEKATEFVEEMKEKYEQATPETQEKIKKGVKTGAMALGALLILKKIFGKKK